MGRRNKKNFKKRNVRRNGRRGVMSDIPHNHTNIEVDFWKIIEVRLSPVTGTNMTNRAILLDPGISQITDELAGIYKLYRFTSVKFVFQAELNQNLVSNLGMNYIPASDTVPTPPPTSWDEFEGPAVGYLSNGRGAPYHYKVPSQILNAMNYNWYETKNADASDLTQGVFYFLSDVPDASIVNVYAHFSVEFQTLEDPAFLSSLGSREVPRPLAIKRPIDQDRDTSDDVMSLMEYRMRKV